MVDKDLINNSNSSNKFLFLDGYGINVRLDDGKLIIQNGDGYKNVFFPKRFPFTNIIIYGTRGSISFEAIRWLTKHDVQISILNWNGKLLTTILPPEAKQTKTKFSQYRTYETSRRMIIAKKLVDTKIKRSKVVLSWLKKKYPFVNDKIEKEYKRLPKAKDLKQLMNVEGRVAKIYWKQIAKLFDKKFDFITRQYSNRPMGAVDPINALFNYGYSLLEAQCRKAINSVGLDTHVGFLHEVTLGKEPLVYDLQEPFRCLVDLAIISGLEKDIFNKKDFIRTENYNIKLRSSGAKKLIKEFEAQINKKVYYRNNWYSWHYIILLKTQELAQYLIGKRKELKFDLPKMELERIDTLKLREKILKIPYSKTKKLGMSKGTLWYLKHNANSDKPFKVYRKVRERMKKL